jgi:DNA-binding NarL/FixJ family response regulator
MSKAEVPNAGAAERQAQAQTVALIAPAGPRREIAQALRSNGLKVRSLDSVEDPALAGDGEDPAATLLWVADTMSSMTTLLEPLLTRCAQRPIVIACQGIQRWELRSALSAGAAGVVTLENLQNTLGICVHAVLSGQICVPRGHWREIEPPVLSTREKQILGLVVMGYMNSQIAEQLFLAESTVKSHLSSAFGKLGVRSRNEAVEAILNPERGLGTGILGLGGEPLQDRPVHAS